ncbi:MAG: DUF2798 domain-containing protein [Rhodomicrobium sp.]|nr:DUF2798 domain-containing protein [Rhodomicrobium sp.]
MTAAFADYRPRVRIVRRAPKRRFQPDWEPVANPYADIVAGSRIIAAPRLPQCFRSAVTGTALTLALTAVVSFGLAVETAGWTPNMASVWLTGWQSAALIAVPARFALAPLVAKLVGRLFEPHSPPA